LLGVLPAVAADYVKFHVDEIACRYCAASLEDLRSQQAANQAGQIDERRKRYFQSSAGYLRRED
jgi:hypothetical protein